jgi:hypothetical protein
MPPADEATLIVPWQQDLKTAMIAQDLRTRASRWLRPPTRWFTRQALAAAAWRRLSPAEGAGTRHGYERTIHRPPSTVDPETRELQQLKHSVRWTIYGP